VSAITSLKNIPVEPAELVIYLYCVVASWPPEDRSIASLDQPTLESYVVAALERDDGLEVVRSLMRVLPRHIENDDDRGQLLTILKCFDFLFLRIHPRSLIVPPTLGSVLHVPLWLRMLAELRLERGYYAEHKEERLIARGPLLRTARGEHAANADSMADRFSAIAVVTKIFRHDHRVISLDHVVIGADRLAGVPLGAPPGDERIVHIPMAVESGELGIKVRTHGNNFLFEYTLVDPSAGAGDHSTDYAVSSFLNAAHAAGKSDILLAPEFTIDSQASGKVGDALARSGVLKHRLVAAGTGATIDMRNGLPWNEMRIYNGLGVLLWSQRKLWPASIDSDTANKLGHPIPAGSAGLEATASGEVLIVADIDTLGRCVILICQDIKLFAANALLHALQCDWVLVPVLDRGVNVGRWTHQATFGLTEDCQTRFIVGSSLAMAQLMGEPVTTPCLLAVGPRRSLDASEPARALALKALDPVSRDRFVTIQWRDENWQASALGQMAP
jgi:hypothetical protein